MGDHTTAAYESERFDEGSQPFDSLGDGPRTSRGTDAPTSLLRDALRDVMGTDPHVLSRARLVLLGECLRVAEMAVRLASDSNWSDAPGNHQQAVDLLERCGNVCNAASVLDMQLRKRGGR